jgi:hypothetical protein
VHVALDRADVRAETRWLRWDASAEGYAGEPDDVLGAEVAQHASMRSELGAARLSDGRHLIVAAKSSDFALAVLLDHAPNASESAVIRAVGSGATMPAHPGAAAVSRVEPIPHPDLIVSVDLEAFERIRQAAGQLSATRVVRDARHIVQSTLRSVDTVSVIGDDQLVITLSDVGHDDLDLVCARIAEALRRVDLPQRVAPIVPVFHARRGEGARLPVRDERAVNE